MTTKLSVRTLCEGGELTTRVWASRDLRGVVSRVTLLIHGFNVTECSAWETYEDFDRRSGLESSPLQVGELCHVYWPGDTPFGVVVSAVAYPLQIPRAKQTGRLLLAYLEELAAARPVEVFMVCHSLGCRAGLEVLNAFLQPGRPAREIRFLGASLMAAAVPVSLVEGTLRQAAEKVRRSVILFSEDDVVLQWAFPAGETAGGEGLFPRAVGRFGEPSRGFWDARRDLAPYNHGDYWSGGRSAGEARELVGLSRARPLPEHSTPRHELAEPASLQSRELRERELAGGRPGCC